ncbi:hypothetical protein GCM10009850_067420 [Nonomuraea monospora]|uniref:Uncharacterized protein n=1 Tax=Nonomuraea monospora TaxID=568818 RepID=A0ABN3CPG6_9ACTN
MSAFSLLIEMRSFPTTAAAPACMGEEQAVSAATTAAAATATRIDFTYVPFRPENRR